jgi:hypothetical protein
MCAGRSCCVRAAAWQAHARHGRQFLPRAETDLYFDNAIKDAGGIGKFVHRREVMDSTSNW